MPIILDACGKFLPRRHVLLINACTTSPNQPRHYHLDRPLDSLTRNGMDIRIGSDEIFLLNIIYVFREVIYNSVHLEFVERLDQERL